MEGSKIIIWNCLDCKFTRELSNSQDMPWGINKSWAPKLWYMLFICPKAVSKQHNIIQTLCSPIRLYKIIVWLCLTLWHEEQWGFEACRQPCSLTDRIEQPRASNTLDFMAERIGSNTSMSPIQLKFHFSKIDRLRCNRGGSYNSMLPIPCTTICIFNLDPRTLKKASNMWGVWTWSKRTWWWWWC